MKAVLIRWSQDGLVAVLFAMATVTMVQVSGLNMHKQLMPNMDLYRKQLKTNGVRTNSLAAN